MSTLGPYVSGVVTTRQVAFHVRELTAQIEVIFGDLRGCAELEHLGRELSTRCRETERELLGDWAAEVKDALTGGEAGMRMKGQLMEITKDGAFDLSSHCSSLF